jgi:hypothetical protein
LITRLIVLSQKFIQNVSLYKFDIIFLFVIVIEE